MKHVDNQEDIKKCITAFENKYPVDQWQVNGIDIWPYIRIIIYMHFLTRFSTTEAANTPDISYSNKFFKLKRKLFLPFKIFKACLSRLIFIFNLKQKKILFFGSHIHRVKQKGEYFNRFYDSIVDYYKLQDDVYMVEYQKIYKNSFNKKSIIELTKQLNNYKLLEKLKRTRRTLNPIVSLQDYNSFLDDLKGFNINVLLLRITPEDLLKWANKILSIQPFFKSFYTRAEPEKIVFLGYYGLDDLYAALFTANQMNIKTIDFQHGPQTNVHMAYSHWLKVPQTGFNTMPVEFWNWDKESKLNIDNWSKNTEKIKSIVFGQPYIHYWLNHKTDHIKKEKTILYSMQTSPLDLFTDKLIDVIKQLNYKWVLRLHPRNKTTIKELDFFLIKNKISNKILIQDAFSTPLPEALTNSVFHVTNYSGCVIESRMLGVPTILIHNIGLEMFKNYIDNKAVYYLNQKDEKFVLNFQELIGDLATREKQNIKIEIGNPLI